MNRLSSFFGIANGSSAPTPSTFEHEFEEVIERPRRTTAASSFSSLSSLSSLSSIDALPCAQSSFSLQSLDTSYRYNTNLKRWHSASLLPRAPSSLNAKNEDRDDDDDDTESCNDYDLWRIEQEKTLEKLQKAQSERDALKILNIELSNNMNLKMKEFGLKTNATTQTLNDYQVLNGELKQQNVDQMKNINDLKCENIAMKQEIVKLNEKNQELYDDVQRKEDKETELQSVITNLKQRVVTMQLNMKKMKAHAEVARDGENPWFWVLTLT